MKSTSEAPKRPPANAGSEQALPEVPVKLLRQLELHGSARTIQTLMDGVFRADKGVERNMRLWLSVFALLLLFLLADILLLVVQPSRTAYLALPILASLAAASYGISAWYRDLDVEDRKIDTIRLLLRALGDDLPGTLSVRFDFRDIDQRRFVTRKQGSLFSPLRCRWYRQTWLELRGSLAGRISFELRVSAQLCRRNTATPLSSQQTLELFEEVRLCIEAPFELAPLQDGRLPEGLFGSWTEAWAAERQLVLQGRTEPRVEIYSRGAREWVGRDALVDFEQLLATLALGLTAIRQLRLEAQPA